MSAREKVLIYLLAFLIGSAALVGEICYFDKVSCGNTGDTRQWLIALIGMVVCLLKGGDTKN